MSTDVIRDEVNRGARLVIYTYCVSILVMTFKRPSDVVLVKSGQSPAAASWPYLIVSLLFGWWGFPWGPIYTIECLYRNLCGGVDVTDDVLRQLFPVAASASAAVTASAKPTTPTLTATPVPSGRRFNLAVASYMLAGICTVAAIGISAYCYIQQQQLTLVLVSGLDRPYGVKLNGESHILAPYSTKLLEVSEGEFLLEGTSGDKVVGKPQKLIFSPPFFSHLDSKYVAIVNPDRTAILINGEVPYYSDGTNPPPNEKPAYSFLLNQLSYLIPRPDYVIVEAEKRISMPSGTTRLVKTRLDHVREPDLPSLLPMVAETSGYPAAKEHLMLLAAQRTDEALLIAAARFLKPEDLRSFYQLRLADRPVLVDWHRYYQNHMESQQPDHDLEKEYADLLHAEPGSGALLYLLGRQTRNPLAQTKLFTDALAAKSPCYYAHSAMGYDALCMGRFSEALAQYEASLKAGLNTLALKYYRRQAFMASGNTTQLLAELTAARKSSPLDLSLANDEMTATYLRQPDSTALEKIHSGCIAAFKASKASDKDMADAEAYLQASMAYLTGDMSAYAKQISRFPVPFYQFRAALSTGDLKAAAKVLSTPNSSDASGQLLLYLLAHQKGDSVAADQHFGFAVAAMGKSDREGQRAALLLNDKNPDAQAICNLRLDIESKRILLTALGVHQSADRSTYFALARKLNFNPEFPHRFLAQFLAQ